MKNNNSLYLQVYKMGIMRSLNYKFEVYGNILMQTIIMVASAFFWRALYKNGQTVKGIDLDTMLSYTIISSLISVVLWTDVERRIEMSVRKGTIAIDMMRPLNIYKMYLAEDLAHITALFFQNMIPILFIGSLMIQVPRPAGIKSFFLFLFSLIIAFFINWLIAVLFGMWAFWVINIDAILQVKKHLIRLLSGSIIPIWFFPEGMKTILELLPFAYLYQLPLEIYLGKYNEHTLVKGLSIQIAWLIVLFIVFLILQDKVTKKIIVQGG